MMVGKTMIKLFGALMAAVGSLAVLVLWLTINIGIPVLMLVALYKYAFGG